eukprot:TRINITY_DN19011_c0_g1_i1.p2 TRINITY_DN19011_c0_g1~~TRINITY_DN19011_c0_g1_i1.p2  ORF type:complete len:138 (+),score=59.57 TRINITY_DN19011_c0_g1_i1:95-508(+)
MMSKKWEMAQQLREQYKLEEEDLAKVKLAELAKKKEALSRNIKVLRKTAQREEDSIRKEIEAVRGRIERLTLGLEKMNDQLGKQGELLKGLGVMIEKEAEDTKQEKPLESNSSKQTCLLYTSPSPRDRQKSRMPSSA